MFYPFPVYRTKIEGGGLKYPQYIRGHHPNCRKNQTSNKPAWNKGLDKSGHPSINRIGFQKGHKPFSNWDHVNKKIKDDPEFYYRWLESKQGQIPWNKGINKKQYPNGIASGPKHGNWKGVGKIRDLEAYRDFRKEMFKRDAYTCQKCGSKKKIELHHIIAVKDSPELIFEPSNVITLCHDCHTQTENYGSKAIRKKQGS